MAAESPDELGKVSAAADACPICGRASTPESAPFCSKRCRDVDLNRWLSGRYVIPGRSRADEADED